MTDIDRALKEEKQYLSDLIIWYRDYYHKTDSGHNELIERLRNTESKEDLEPIWVVVNAWLDNMED